MSSGNDDPIPDSNPEPIEATAISDGKSGAGAATSHPRVLDQDADHLRLLSIFHYVTAAIAALFSLLPLLHAIAIAVAGRKLRRQTGYLYCLVIAAVECLFMPLGTVLGVFTIIVLMRPSVKERFGVTSPEYP